MNLHSYHLGLLTLGTFEGLDTLVTSLVLFQFVGAVECLVTHVTLEGPLACVCPDVAIQVFLIVGTVLAVFMGTCIPALARACCTGSDCWRG